MSQPETTEQPATRADRRSLCMIATAKAACDQRLRDAVEAIRQEGHTLDVRVTWEGSDGKRFAKEAAQHYDTIIAAGGDGTLNCVVNGVMEAGNACTIGLVPMGTANDFATSCGISLEPREALEVVLANQPYLIDVGRIDEKAFVNVASGGVGTSATVESNQSAKNMLGGLSYLLTGLRQAASFQPHHAAFSGPDFAWEGAFYAVAVGNNRQAGGGFKLCPSAVLNDGLLDLMIIPEIPTPQLVALAGALRNGALADEPAVIYAQLPWLEIYSPEELQMNLDGEPCTETRFRFSMLPHCVRMYLPETAPLKKQGSGTRE